MKEKFFENANVIISVNYDDLLKLLKEVSGKTTEKVDDDELLTTEEAMTLAKVSRPTLHRWKKAGLIPFIKIGKNVRYRKSDFIDAITKKTLL